MIYCGDCNTVDECPDKLKICCCECNKKNCSCCFTDEDCEHKEQRSEDDE